MAKTVAGEENRWQAAGGDLTVEFDALGRMRALRRMSTGYAFLEGTPSSPWRLELRDRAGRSRTVTALDADACRIERAEAGLRLRWVGIRGAPGLIVSATVVPEDDLLQWRLAVEGMTPDAALWRADFPVLAGIRPIAVGDAERLLLPRAGGYVVRDPSAAIFANDALGRAVSLAYPGGMTMQCLAYYRQQEGGLLAIVQDPDGHYKRLTLRGDDRSPGWTLVFEHFPAGMPQASGRFVPPYPVALVAFTGDWSDAAARYRTWAITQPWCRRGPLHARDDLPRWLLETGLWVWNRGRSDQVLPGARQLSKRLQVPVALDWYWWHQTPYDTHFPDYLPPREGEDAFRAAIEHLHAHGMRAIVYLNGRLWGTGAPSWDERDVRQAACKREDGDIYREVYNVFNRAEMAPMCPTTDLWQATLSELAEALVGRFGLDGLYIDQIGIASPQLCFDPQHPHPPGGGNHWYQGYRRLVARVRDAMRSHPDVMLATEGSCEVYLDQFDAFLVLDNSFERMGFYRRIGLNWEPVPLFAAVYHDHALHFGSYASLAPPPYDERWPRPQGPVRSRRFDERDFADAFYAELGRAFVAGAQPMVANVSPEQLADPRLQPHWRFLRELVRTRLEAAPFLIYGRWLQPPELEVPEITVAFLVRGIYTRPDEEEVIQRRMPAVLASQWMAPDGRRGLALTNISDRPQRIAWRVDDVDGGWQAYRIDGRGRRSLGRLSGVPFTYEEVIPARSVALIELGP